MKRKIFLISVFVVLISVLVFCQESSDSLTQSQKSITPPLNLKVQNMPDDAGERLKLSWESPSDFAPDYYQIFRKSADSPDSVKPELVTIVYHNTTYIDKSPEIEHNKKFLYYVRSVSDTLFSDFAESGVVWSKQEWWRMDSTSWIIFLTTLIFFSSILYYTNAAKRGKDLYIRPIAGLNEVEQAVGRATEMGKPILFVPGLSTISDVATIAALNILNQIAKTTAEYETPLYVPVADYIVLPIAQEMVREAYVEAGREDAFDKDNVFFISVDQFAYVAGVSGLMARQKPAANFFMGMFYAESLILTETGSMTGAIQIAGTDADTQLPFFITTCDYTLIGEELYAASAYLSKEPNLTATLKAQDFIKLLIVTSIIIGTLTLTFGWHFFADLFPLE